MKEPARSIAMLLVLTGLRISEILALRWKCVDLAGSALQVAETVYDGHFDTPKSQKSARLIPLAAVARAVLARLWPRRGQPNDLVFRTEAGRPLNRHNLLRRHLRPACRELGIEGINWHSLRHSHATLLDTTGAPLGTVQALLGHATSEIKLSAYREGLTYHYVLSAEQGKSVSLPFGEVKPQGGSMVMRIAELRKSECCPVIGQIEVALPLWDHITSPETEPTSRWYSNSRTFAEPMNEATQMTTAQAVGAASHPARGLYPLPCELAASPYRVGLIRP